MSEILLGDEVKCRYTGLRGIVLSRVEFINGCIQFGLAQKWEKGQPLVEAAAEINIDSQNLVIVKKGERHKKEKKVEHTGGAMRVMKRR